MVVFDLIQWSLYDGLRHTSPSSPEGTRGAREAVQHVNHSNNAEINVVRDRGKEMGQNTTNHGNYILCCR